MKTSKSQDELIRQALREAHAVEQAELLRDYDTSPLSPDFEDRLRARIEQEIARQHQSPTSPRRKRKIPLRYLIAAVLALVMLLGCTTVVACPALRDRVVRLFQKEDARRGNTHYTAVVEGEERSAFDIPTYYTLGEVPAGFLSIESYEEPQYVSRIWLKSDSASGAETVISFDQIPLNTLCILSTEGCTKETVTLHSHEATLYTKPGSQRLVWYTEECMFVLAYWGADTQGLEIFSLADTITLSKSQTAPSPII